MIKNLNEIPSFLAGDHTHIQELLNAGTGHPNMSYSLAVATLLPGKSSLPHRLVKSSEVYFILQGEGIMFLEDENFPVKTGDTVFIPANALQWIQHTGTAPLRFLCIVSPPWKAEDEVVGL